MEPVSWKVKSLLEVSEGYLKERHIEAPRLTAEVLLAHQLGIERIQLYLNFDKPLTKHEVDGYRRLVKRRVNHEPTQYITGVQEFWSLEMKVDHHVLIPRPESEVIVETAIEKLSQSSSISKKVLNILEIGTGSGAISIALAKELSNVSIYASDISSDALRTAASNAERHNVSEKIKFIKGDLFPSIKDRAGPFDMIVSNPPYVSREDFLTLAPEIRDHEPKLALDGGKKGLYFIDKIIRNGAEYLQSGGWLIIEMSPEQTVEALLIIEKTGLYSKAGRITDYSGLYRLTAAQKT